MKETGREGVGGREEGRKEAGVVLTDQHKGSLRWWNALVFDCIDVSVQAVRCTVALQVGTIGGKWVESTEICLLYCNCN